MKGDARVIAVLNDVLTNELTAINQYFLHARLCENWGYERLWKKVRAESILYLEGHPNLQKLGKLEIGETVAEQLKSDLALEKRAIPVLNSGIALCRDRGDNGTAELLEEILVDEEEHADWLEAQLTLVEQVGIQNYLAQQVKEDE
jgi:bacterioferritin